MKPLYAPLWLAFLLTISAVAAEESPEPGALVKQLYEAHDAHKGPFFQGDRSLLAMFFTKDFGDLIWKATRNARGEVGALDFDPLYFAQDTEVKNFTIHKASANAKKGEATVKVSFINFGEEVRLIFLLKQAGEEAWRIDEIRYSEGGDTLREILKSAG